MINGYDISVIQPGTRNTNENIRIYMALCTIYTRCLSVQALKTISCLILCTSLYKGSTVTFIVQISGQFYYNNLTNRRHATIFPSSFLFHRPIRISAAYLAASIFAPVTSVLSEVMLISCHGLGQQWFGRLLTAFLASFTLIQEMVEIIEFRARTANGNGAVFELRVRLLSPNLQHSCTTEKAPGSICNMGLRL